MVGDRVTRLDVKLRGTGALRRRQYEVVRLAEMPYVWIKPDIPHPTDARERRINEKYLKLV